ncbi:AAA family ATPase [Pseudomonas sp. 10B1]|uniref:AAA family ATPase n=1 Tax=unclassified Pseudomonas TaxID=196821 RepID=UPI002B232B29|nr:MULTISPECIES: AAA family ATPase [unclassified Pseudomonas]MEA9996278.1 AAA family ATPase [Pseudomonas sp. AA4]MEB0086680.1 AAA family ATPase [Pseudomonas sp. RTI1]MEB0124730.1 AAA family ATPase [Pseudomonas sp. CCC1.2]MEB0154897.1 AAA family ATPase [Pseudomonas sp. CCC4.3]MEB0217897.1 AAA family ATPase [Pseudomonas sp. AB12(2023)]
MTAGKSMTASQGERRRLLTKVGRENLFPDNIPAELKALPVWVVWKWGEPKGNGKFHKPPYYPVTGKPRRAASDASDASNLGTFDEAIAAFKAGPDYAGVGIAISSSLGLVALDFDNVVESGIIAGDVSQLVDLTYAEFSPSQKGIRAFYKGDAEPIKGRRLEIFTATGYVTVTGHVIKNTFDDDIDGRLPTLEPELRSLLEHMAGSRGDAKATDDDDFLANIDNEFPETPANIKKLKSALKTIGADGGHDDWVKTLFAIKATRWGDIARDIAEEWSKTDPEQFNEDDFDEAWRSGKDKSGGVTVASVFGRAMDNGWENPSKRHTDIDALVAAMTPQLVGEYGSKPPYRWLIKRLLPRLGISMIYGDSTAGKTFLAIDMAMAIARGVPMWCGSKVAQGKVVFIAAEDASGVALRYHAYLKNAGIRESELDGQFTIICQAPNLLDDNYVLALIKGIGHADLIIMDTLASVMAGGNENTGESMGKVIDSAKRISMETGSVVLLVHHSGKNQAAGARGWSGMRAGVDAEFCITQDKDGKTRVIEATKIKNGVQGKKFAFMLQQVDLGRDEDGEPESSCVVQFLDSIPAAVREARVPKGRYEIPMHKIINEHQPLTHDNFIQLGVNALEMVDGKRDRRRDNVCKAIQDLDNKNFIEKGTDGLYRLPKTYYPKQAIHDGDEPFDEPTVNEGDEL